MRILLRRWFVAAIFSLWLARGLFADEALTGEALLKLKEKDFIEAAEAESLSFYDDSSHLTAPELVAITCRLAETVRSRRAGQRDDDSVLNPFRSYFERACLRADDAGTDALVDVYSRLPLDSVEKSMCLPSIAARVLEREIRGFKADPRHVVLETAKKSSPPALRACPVDLQDAWRLYQAAKAPFEAAFPPPKEVMDSSANERTFYRLIDSALKGSTGLTSSLRQFAWTGANCLGVTDVEDAQDMATLLVLLRERKLDQAVGAALRVLAMGGSTSEPEKVAPAVIDFLTAAEVDWETVVAGAVVDGAFVNESAYPRPSIRELAEYGSGRGAKLMFELARLDKPQRRNEYVGAFDRWIETSDSVRDCEGQKITLHSSRRTRTKRTGPSLTPDLQHASLRLTEEFVRADYTEDLARDALSIFARTQAPTSVPALRILAQQRSVSISADAETILCAMGLSEPPRRARSSRLRFRILADGKPLEEGTQVGWTLGPNGNGVSSSDTIRADGLLEISSLDDLRGGSEEGAEVQLRSGDDKPDRIIFDATIPYPVATTKITEVNIKTTRLEFALRNREELNAPPPDKVTLRIEPHRDRENLESGRVFEEGDEFLATPNVVLPRVQEGAYDVWIGTSGAEVWFGTLSAGAAANPVEVDLKPASDLRYEIVAPNGRRWDWAPLYRDGKEFYLPKDRKTGAYRSLPCGTYNLRIFGSDRDLAGMNGPKLKRGPDEVPFIGRDVPFEVKPGSPSVIDLGEIHLLPAAK